VPKHPASPRDRGRVERASADVPLTSAGAAILRRQYAQVRAVEAGARTGEDGAAVHQMRVAARRLRAALRLFVVDDVRDAFEPLEAVAREIARALGAVRDLDVLADDLRARAAIAPAHGRAIGVLLAAQRRVRADRREDLRQVLDGPAARCLWEALPDAADALERAADPRLTVRAAAPELLRRRLRRLARSLRGIAAPTAAELHRVRVRCKRLRDACEFFEPWLGKRVAPLIAITTDLQDTLGALHDGDVAPEVLQVLVGSAPPDGGTDPTDGRELADAILWLVGDRQRRRDELLDRFRDQWAQVRSLARTTNLRRK
jgi:CHAD domain-containing protein